MDHEVLKEMEKAFGESKTLEMLTVCDFEDDVYDDDDVTLHKEFCRHLMIGIGRNTSLSDLHLDFLPHNWPCPNDGRLVYVSHMLCYSVGCSV